MQIVKWPYKLVRSLLMGAVVILFAIPAILYVALSLPSVQRKIADGIETELSRMLTVDVTIGNLSVTPFNRVALQDVAIEDASGKKAITVNRLAAGISLWDFVARNRVVITFAELSGLDGTVYKATPDSPLNIQPIIDALKPKDKTKPPTKFDLKFNTVVIRDSRIKYDVLSLPCDSSRFNPAHIHVSNLSADVMLPGIKNDDFTVELRRLSFQEQSGIKVANISGNFHVTPSQTTATGMVIDLASTHIVPADIKLDYNGYDDLKNLWFERPVVIDIQQGSFIGSADMVPFVPALAGLNTTFYIDLRAEGNRQRMNLERLELSSSYGIEFSAAGEVASPLSPKEMRIDIPALRVDADMAKVADFIRRFRPLDAKAERMLRNMAHTELTAAITGSIASGNIEAKISGAAGAMDIASTYFTGKTYGGKGKVTFDSFSGATLMKGMENALADLGNFTAAIDYDFSIVARKPQGKVSAEIADVVYRNHHFTDISARASADGHSYAGTIMVDNPGVLLDLDATATLDGPEKRIYINLAARDVEPALFNIDADHPERRFSIFCIGELSGPDVDHLSGQIDIDDLSYGSESQAIYLQDFDFELTNDGGYNSIRLNSDVVDGVVEGEFRLSALPRVCRGIVTEILPQLTAAGSAGTEILTEGSVLPADTDRLLYSFTIKDTSPIEPLIKMPVQVIYPIDLTGGLDASQRTMSLRLDAPYLQQGSKLIENTSLSVKLQGASATDSIGRGDVTLSTMVPTKKGQLTLLTSAHAVNNQVDTRVEWKVARDRDFSGNISLSAAFDRDEEQALLTRVNVNPGRMVFNDTVWTVEPSVIDVQGNRAEVNNFRVGRDNQFVTIEGVASSNPADTLVLTLQDVNLDYVFETLDIQTAMFGGNATGVFYATELFTKTPKAFTPGLNVKALTYNHSLMGDAYIKSAWEPATKAITLNANISQPNGRHSKISGNIKPMADSLDLAFDADRIGVGFLLPFMSAFATDIKGYASGHARLYGSFKLIDMVGDVYGEDVSLTLGFTNTTYTTTDSVHFRPGRIDLPGLVIHDVYGNTAVVDGWVTHECFKQPRFDFRVHDARNLLVYDIKESPETRWFGHVFGDGSATVSGRPGIVEIGANIRTAANSSFTFVLSDELDAQDYKFITFRDRDQAKKDSIATLNAPPPIVQKLKAKLAAQNQDASSSVYVINLVVDVTPQAQVTLIMDPTGGDKIRAYGTGTMRMGYDSANEDLRLNGTYTVERGKYNFTLQDIIIKEFTIKDGSSITFTGNPYAADLDIAATYSVNANLSDLDESFLADKDLNRTNVPVNAVLLVTGDMRRPDINFDLEFPSLTQDIDRKVKSIVNTKEMMSRQIIYLLALNRFYTPDYMSATKGNELVSVASSTISSQLSNMLGQLSDKWSLAPNFRSDRGDFSDVEVDVALSSHLLNNRLLLNGNFGYRDKSLNNNSFIGDFDIEYLLNRRGTIRLKAYNRYNDQNYYVKTALTTQGVGIMFKRDFDNVFSFLRPLLRHKKEPADTNAAKADTLRPNHAQPADTLAPK